MARNGLNTALSDLAPSAPTAAGPANLQPDGPEPAIFRSESELEQLPASERVRYRLLKAGRRFHANDNIAAFVQAGEITELKAEVQAKLKKCCRPW